MLEHIVLIFKTFFSLTSINCFYKHRLLFLLLTLSWLALPGCLHNNKIDSISEYLEEKQRLEQDLENLLGFHDEEVGILAQTAFQKTNDLSKIYDITGSSKFHNLLVNMGIKDRGLCCHWTKDLLFTLNDLDLRKFSITWAVSNYGSFREHSSVAVVPEAHPFSDGLILDPWRHAGKLYWSKIDQDSYRWIPHPAYDGTVDSIECESQKRNLGPSSANGSML